MYMYGKLDESNSSLGME